MRKVSLALWEEESGVYSPDSLFSIVWRLVPRFRLAIEREREREGERERGRERERINLVRSI